MPWVQNVSLDAIAAGQHMDAGSNSMLIQIVDPGQQFPRPRHRFKEVHQFRFEDVEDPNDPNAITVEQAERIAELLKLALRRRMNLVVHCVAGIYRSGAIAQLAVDMGFADTEAYRNPNTLVKSRVAAALGVA
jgi:predicted protein tyrosine phosphatase